MVNNKRTAREIKLSNDLLDNKNLNIKIGTVENRESPDTIYIFTSFWLEPKKEFINKDQEFLKKILESELQKIYEKELKDSLRNNIFFPIEKDNIFIKNIPENLNYNGKRNYISIELYLHTLNIKNVEKIPLSCKKNTELFDECVKISNKISNSNILKNSNIFSIHSKSL